MQRLLTVLLVVGLAGVYTFGLTGCGIAQAQSLDRGHRILLDRGLQLNAMVALATTGYFDTARWAESNFTTIDFIGSHYPTALMPPPPGVPWANIAENNTVAPFINVNLEAYRPSLVRVQLSDERDITDSNVLAWDKACTEVMHDRLPDVIVNLNLGGIPAPAAMLNYMQYVQPDMLMFDHYPFDNPHKTVVGGSPTILYEHLEQYRKYGLQGLDGTGTRPIPTGMYTQTFAFGKYRISESEIRLNNFSAWAFGCKLINSFTYDKRKDSNTPPVMFTGYGTARPTLQFYYVAATNRQSLNLGPALVRLISTDLRMKMGLHPQVTGGPAFNTKPYNVSSWDSAADPYITNITATNLGSKNGGFRGDVIVGYFKPLAPELTNPGHEDDIYFMVLNGLSAASGTAAETLQSIILDFDFGDSGINSLLRLNRNTGEVDEVSLIHNGDSLYRLELSLPGGTGDLFKFNNGGRFVGEFLPGDANLD